MVIKSIRRPWIDESKHRHNIRNDRGFDYQSSLWRNTSRAFLAANPKCDQCGAPSKVSDHHVRIKDGGDPYAWSNLRPKCGSCHNKKDNNAGKRKHS